MEQLEQYVQKNSEQQKQEFYQQEINRGLSEVQEQQPVTAQEVFDKFEDRLSEKTSFEQRTEYYFKDSGYLEAKAQRYRNIAANKSKLVSYATAHKNHNSKKRKDYANNAATFFEKAAALEKNEEDGTGVALYNKREKIMRLRMEGMIEAAKAKSTDEADEKRRILKAKYSCLSILNEQVKVISLSADGMKYSKEFEEKRKSLEKELAKVREDIEKSFPTSNLDKWQNANSLTEDGIKKSLKERKKENPDITLEGERIISTMSILSKEGKRPEYAQALDSMKRNQVLPNLDDSGAESRIVSHPCYIVKRDKNGNPIDKAELKKDQWNRKWLKALGENDTRTKKYMIREAYQRFEKIEFPTPAQINKGGVMQMFKKDPVAFYEMLRMATSFDNYTKVDPYAKKYMEEHPELKKKADMAAKIGVIFHAQASMQLVQQASTEGEYSVSKHSLAEMADMAEGVKETIKAVTEEYKNDYKKKTEKAVERKLELKEMSLTEMQQIQPAITKEVYNLIQRNIISHEAQSDPAMEKILIKAWIGRDASACFRAVHYKDDSFEPLTEKDRQNLEWNKKWLKSVANNDLKTQKNMLDEECPRLKKRMESFLKNQESLSEEWFDNMIKDPTRAEEFMELHYRCHGGMQEAESKKYLEEHSDFRAVFKAFSEMASYLVFVLQKKYKYDPIGNSITGYDPKSDQPDVHMHISPYEGEFADELAKVIETNYVTAYKKYVDIEKSGKPAGTEAPGNKNKKKPAAGGAVPKKPVEKAKPKAAAGGAGPKKPVEKAKPKPGAGGAVPKKPVEKTKPKPEAGGGAPNSGGSSFQERLKMFQNRANKK